MSMRFNTPVFRPQDNKGRTLPGAQLFFYENYSTTPKTTYANVALTNPNPHPIIADGAGKFTDIFLGIGDYRVILTDRKGQILWDRNDVSVNDLTADVINDIERQLTEVLNLYRMQNLGEYGVADPDLEKTFTEPNAQYVVYNDQAWWTVSGTPLPYTTDSVTYPDPASDPNLQLAPNVTFNYVDTGDQDRQKETTGLSEITLVNGGDDLFPLIGQGIRVAGVGLWVVPSLTKDGSSLPNPSLLDSVPTSNLVTVNGGTEVWLTEVPEILKDPTLENFDGVPVEEDPDGRGVFAPSVVTSLQQERKNGVTLRHILGSAYNPANDGAGTLNSFLPELAGNGIVITDPDNTQVLCTQPVRIVNDMKMDLGILTTFLRGYSDASLDTGALFSRDDWSVDTNNVEINGGILKSIDGETGKLMNIYGNNNRIFRTKFLNYAGGQAMIFGGANMRMAFVNAVSRDDGQTGGDGAFRMVGGSGLNAFGLFANCADDCFQFVPITSNTNARFNQSISDSFYIGCQGVSRSARLLIAAIAGPQDENLMTATLRRLGWQNCSGAGGNRVLNIENSEGTGAVSNQIDDIRVIDCNLNGGNQDASSNNAIQIFADDPGRKIGKVTLERTKLTQNDRPQGIFASQTSNLVISDSDITGETNALQTQTGVDKVSINQDTIFRVQDFGGGNAPGNVLQGAGIGIANIDGLTCNGISSNNSGIRLPTSGTVANIQDAIGNKQGGAVNTNVISHATGVEVIAGVIGGTADNDETGTGDYKDVPAILSQADAATVQVVTPAQLADAGNSVNTSNKVAGVSRAYDSVNELQYFATGNNPTDDWKSFEDGSTITPS